MKRRLVCFLLLFILLLSGCSQEVQYDNKSKNINVKDYVITRASLENIPKFKDEPFVEINENIPYFDDKYKNKSSFESYSELDELGRCKMAFANIGKDLMPTEERGSIGMIKPSGWHTVKYDIVDGKYLYNRCHLIGFQLTGENANPKNLITGTRYLNVEGMLPFENLVAGYIKETNNHVLYRVTPIYEGNNLVASGVQMEAESVEDNGRGIQFNVYCYNNQPNIEINYANGTSHLVGKDEHVNPITKVIGNRNSKKYHSPECGSLPAKKNQIVFDSIQEANKAGYESHSCIK